jgi:rod shape-determining protein MreD
MEKFRWFRYFAYTIEILVFYMVQETPGLIPEVRGARPLLLIPVALSIALFEKEQASMSFGLLSGLLIDFGMGGTLGFHGLLLAVVCYFLSVLAADLIRTNFLTAMLVAVIVTAAILILQWVFFYLLADYSDPAYALTAHYIPRFVYTVALMPVVYYFNRALALQLRAKEE